AGKGTIVTWTADDKIKGQMGDRGWTDADIDAAIAAGPKGTSTDNRSPKKTDDKLGRNDPATVYGKPGSYVVINDRTGEVTQVSDKIRPGWTDDSRIQWNKK
ncbi:colicin E5-related ribonuclease, partial [Commensalibacter nepenthis]